jgi:hypothetical protein
MKAMSEIQFPPALPGKPKKKRKGIFMRIRPEIERVIRVSARQKGMTQAHFLETCVALHGADAKAGLCFKFEILKQPA